jgi:hypothetical protein
MIHPVEGQFALYEKSTLFPSANAAAVNRPNAAFCDLWRSIHAARRLLPNASAMPQQHANLAV